MDKPFCDRCQFYKEGSCRRYPPVHLGNKQYGFPKVDAFVSCGEFRNKNDVHKPAKTWF